jgi:hypothetical protein
MRRFLREKYVKGLSIQNRADFQPAFSAAAAGARFYAAGRLSRT